MSADDVRSATPHGIPLPAPRPGRRFLFGYLPFTAAALAIAYAIIMTSQAWAALLAGGILLLAWSVLLLISQLVILFVRYDAWFFLKAAAITLFNLFGTPFLAAGLWTGVDSLVLGKPDVEQHIAAVSGGRCTVTHVKHAVRVGRTSYQISATVQCPGAAPQYCVWWFLRKEGVWRLPEPAGERCPKLSWGAPRDDGLAKGEGRA